MADPSTPPTATTSPAATMTQEPDPPLYTASAINMQASAWVLRMAFGEVGPANADGKVASEYYRIAVGLPWPLAKLIHQYMGLAIEAYEKQEGTIAVPRSLQAKMEEAKAKAATK